MKNVLLITFVMVAIMSCSNDDSPNNTEIIKSYFPIHNDNSWNYASTSIGNINTHFMGNETFSGTTFKQLINQDPVFGFEGNSYVTKMGNDYFLYSNISLADFPPLVIENQKFLDEGNAVGSQINAFDTSVVLNSTPINDPNFNGNVTPTIKFHTTITMGDHYDQITLNGSSVYTDVIKVNWTYTLETNLNISGTYSGFPVNLAHPLISPQQVGTLTQYYANDIGVVRSIFMMNYNNLNYNTTINVAGASQDISSYILPLQQSLASININNVSELGNFTVID